MRLLLLMALLALVPLRSAESRPAESRSAESRSAESRPAELATVGGSVARQPGQPAAGDKRPTGGTRPGTAASTTSYQAPVRAGLRVVRPFSPPLDAYGAGHLGVDLVAAQHQAVVAAGAGVVRFAGTVAGRGVVVVAHADGVSTEYEPVLPVVSARQQVRAGQPIGQLVGQHAGCPLPSCLHWGARRGSAYLNPLDLLRPLGVVRLLPWDCPPTARGCLDTGRP